MRAYQYYPLYPGGRRKAFTVSYDDGNDCDARLCEMLRAHHAKGTFNINAGMFGAEWDAPVPRRWRRMTERECVEVYGDDMEVALHGLIHPFWDRMSTVAAMRDILDDKRGLERVFGREIRGAASPYGRITDDVAEILRLAGIAYCRTMPSTKRLRFCCDDPLHFAGTVRHRDPEAIPLAREFADDPVSNGIVLLYYLCGHSYEFIERDNWNVMEEILSIACDREDTWYCTNIELFDWRTAVLSLRWNVQQDTVENPSTQDIWLYRTIKHRDPDAITVKVPGGQTVKL